LGKDTAIALQTLVAVLEGGRDAHALMLEQLFPLLWLDVERPQVRREADRGITVVTVQDLNEAPVVLRRHHQRITTVDDDSVHIEALHESFDLFQLYDLFRIFREMGTRAERAFEVTFNGRFDDQVHQAFPYQQAGRSIDRGSHDGVALLLDTVLL
jgi:hypothetical protein